MYNPGEKMTACEVLSSDFIDNLVKQDDVFRVLRNLRGSPPYWKQAKKDVFAMLRQLGIPTWFCSFSAAETKWTPLLICLSKLVKGKIILSPKEVNSLTWEKSVFWSNPSDMCSIFWSQIPVFSSLCTEILNESDWSNTRLATFTGLHFSREDLHMLPWIKDAPVYNGTVEKFIDSYVTCKKMKTCQI